MSFMILYSRIQWQKAHTFALLANSLTIGPPLCSSVSSTSVNGLALSRRFSSFWNRRVLCVLLCWMGEGAISTIRLISGDLMKLWQSRDFWRRWWSGGSGRTMRLLFQPHLTPSSSNLPQLQVQSFITRLCELPMRVCIKICLRNWASEASDGSSKQALSVGVKMADFRTREHQESLHYALYFSPFNFLKSIPTLGIPLKKLPNLNSK
jgi:hypothetical protein